MTADRDRPFVDPDDPGPGFKDRLGALYAAYCALYTTPGATVCGRRIHPAALASPPMTEDEWRALVASIEDHGLSSPIRVSVDGAILDGISRASACEAAGVAPDFLEYFGDLDPDQFSWDANVVRRHIDRGFLAVQLARREMAEGATHGGARPNAGRPCKDGEINQERIPALPSGRDRKSRAKAAGIDRDTVRKARKLLEYAAAHPADKSAAVIVRKVEHERKGVEFGEWFMKKTPEARAKHAMVRFDRAGKPRLPPERRSITKQMVKETRGVQAAVIVAELMPEANRYLASEGEKWIKVPLKGV